MPDDLTPNFVSDLTSAEPAPAKVQIESTVPLPSDATVISFAPPIMPQLVPPGKLPSELAQSLLGQQLGDILLEEFVGGGGMGAVFRGRDVKLHRTVAVKVLATQRVSASDSQRRFEMEARSAARLDHPNIARVHFVGEERGIRFLVFEYIEGSNLRDLVNANGPFALADALRYMLQIADALMHAWQRDVVHRDIKPSNILLTPDGQAKLVDMGLARFDEGEPNEPEMTATGVTLGTFDYMAPEQARDSRSADIRSDIYSLGCTLYFALAGKPPFADSTGLQKLLQHQTEAPPNLQDVRPDVSESVVEVIETMLAKRPEDRFQNPAELLAALIAVTEQLGVVYPQISLPAGWSPATTPRTWPERNAPWLVPAALLLLSVLALGIVWNRQQPVVQFPELQLEAASETKAEGGGGTAEGNSSMSDRERRSTVPLEQPRAQAVPSP